MRQAPPGFDPTVWASLEEARRHLQAGETAQGLAIYESTWKQVSARGDHFHATVIAHMAGAAEPEPEKKHRWNESALREADAISEVIRGRGMYASLYNNLGMSHIAQGRTAEARRAFELALSHTAEVQPAEQATQMRAAIERNIARLDAPAKP